VADKPARKVVCTMRDDRCETIPVAADFELPIVNPNEVFVYFEAVDGSEVGLRADSILMMHLKDY
jgi:hypothetical protein